MIPLWKCAKWIASCLATSSACALLSCGPSEPVPLVFDPLPDPSPSGPVVLPYASAWVPATPWPTFTPVPTPWPSFPFVPVDLAERPLPTFTPVPGEARVVGVLRPTPSPRRLDCTVHFRGWLLDRLRLRDARHLRSLLGDFRLERPDCVYGKFDPVFVDAALCRDDDRVAGVRVSGPLSRGDAYNRDLRLDRTRSDSSGNVLIHFQRLPLVNSPGCWYFHARSGLWYEQALSHDDSGPSIVVAPFDRPTPTPFPADIRTCDGELRDLIARAGPALRAPLVGQLVLEVQTGLGHCAVSWAPALASHPVDPVCPQRPSGFTDRAGLVLHWSVPPGDGASCWFYDPATRAWSSR